MNSSTCQTLPHGLGARTQGALIPNQTLHVFWGVGIPNMNSWASFAYLWTWQSGNGQQDTWFSPPQYEPPDHWDNLPFDHTQRDQWEPLKYFSPPMRLSTWPQPKTKRTASSSSLSCPTSIARNETMSAPETHRFDQDSTLTPLVASLESLKRSATITLSSVPPARVTCSGLSSLLAGQFGRAAKPLLDWRAKFATNGHFEGFC